MLAITFSVYVQVMAVQLNYFCCMFYFLFVPGIN